MQHVGVVVGAGGKRSYDRVGPGNRSQKKKMGEEEREKKETVASAPTKTYRQGQHKPRRRGVRVPIQRRGKGPGQFGKSVRDHGSSITKKWYSAVKIARENESFFEDSRDYSQMECPGGVFETGAQSAVPWSEQKSEPGGRISLLFQKPATTKPFGQSFPENPFKDKGGGAEKFTFQRGSQRKLKKVDQTSARVEARGVPPSKR